MLCIGFWLRLSNSINLLLVSLLSMLMMELNNQLLLPMSLYILLFLLYIYGAVTEWSGGLYVSPTIAGSRPGALIAGAWAAMISLGQEGAKLRFIPKSWCCELFVPLNCYTLWTYLFIYSILFCRIFE